jgi:hypothetical protein
MRDRKAEALWRAKLAASGFEDLEGADRDGPLSDRGNLHAVDASKEAGEQLAHRIESGAAYTTWATEVLHSHRFRSSLEREIWSGHANGEGLRETAKRLVITFHRARETVVAIKQRVSNQSKKSNKGDSQWRPGQLQRKYRRLSMSKAVALAALLLRTQTPSSTRRSA